jgi:DNA-binding NarL/FixJ family response regulator
LDGQFDQWAQKLTKELINEDEFRRFNQTLRERREETRTRLADIACALEQKDRRDAMAKRVRDIVLDFPQVWQHLDVEERRNILSLLVEDLTIHREKRDVTMKIKLHLLPEREVQVYVPTWYKDKSKLKGVEGLTMRHLVLLYHVGEGKSRDEILSEMCIRYHTYREFAATIRKRVGIHDLKQAAEMARSRIEALRDSLPLGMQKKREEHLSHGPILSEILMAVFPLFVQGAQVVEIAEITGLTRATVTGRKNRILSILGAKSMYVAGQKAKELGVL